MKKVALIYDFDKTLCDRDMQEYSLIPELGYDKPGLFWGEVDQIASSQHMDHIGAYLYLLMRKFAESGRPLTREAFDGIGNSIKLYPGVDTWFSRINAAAKECGLEAEHYIISSGMLEILEDTPIAGEFRKIYACSYYYDENGYAVWPGRIVNYTTKTQFIFRINKQVLDEDNEADLNAWVPMKQRPIPFERRIYIADGITDVPCMRLVKMNGGRSIAVYNPQSAKAGLIAERLLREGRANFMAGCDYTKDSTMEKLVKKILLEMSAHAQLEDLEGIIQ